MGKYDLKMQVEGISEGTGKRERESFQAFDTSSGSFVERLIFNNRVAIILVCALITAVLGWSASRIAVTADYSSTLPTSQAFVQNYEQNKTNLRALGDSVRIVVENKSGNVYSRQYLETLRQLNDSVFLMHGVDRSFMESLWTPVVRWTAINEQGMAGGPVMPDSYDGSDASISQLRQNVQIAGITGSLVANDQRSSTIFVPLLDTDPTTGKPFNYGQFWSDLQAKIKTIQTPTTKIYVIGFAAIMGTLIADLHEILGFFLIAIAISAIFIYAFTRCVRSTCVILSCSFIAVIWLLGIMCLLGLNLDPYSILVPFLVFAIGVSHGAQKMNGIMQDIGRGTHRLIAARLTFRRLFIAGLTALVADAVGFAVLAVINIPAIRTLSHAASIGVSVLVFTNLVLLPIILSFIGVSRQASLRSLKTVTHSSKREFFEVIFTLLEHFTDRRWASVALAFAAVLTISAFVVGRGVQIGDVRPGAAEFWTNSVYNKSNAYVVNHYALSNDQFAVIVNSQAAGFDDFRTILEMDRFEQYMKTIPGVQTTVSAADYVRSYSTANFEGNLKWWTIPRDKSALSNALTSVYTIHPDLLNIDMSAGPLILYLTDHKARTLTRVTQAAQKFISDNGSDSNFVQFSLAAGSAGMDAATNIVVRRANIIMPYLVYAAVIALCFISFRSWRAVIVAIVPLLITSIFCQALMVWLGIGIKVATLPVVALGVGIGVDYALYLLSVQLTFQRTGVSLRVAYSKALRFTGRIVALVGFTLASGVVLWAFSPIKYQADMGILLAFMFLWNMIGALILVPALSCFLLQTKWVAKGSLADPEMTEVTPT